MQMAQDVVIDTRRVFLWSCPRSLSSVFYTSISTLPKTKCFLEPFFHIACFGPDDERKWFRYQSGYLPNEFHTLPTLKNLKDSLLKKFVDTNLIFIKDFPYSLSESTVNEVLYSPDFSEYQHTFLVRDPERCIPSYFKLEEAEGELDDSELCNIEFGYRELYQMYLRVQKKLGQPPITVDAEDLQTQPELTMKAYCDVVGVHYDSQMMTWKPNALDCLRIWRPWFSDVLNSSGFIKKVPSDKNSLLVHDKLPKKVIDYIEECCPYYTEMKNAKLKF